MTDRIKWIALSYSLPAEPSRCRVAVWRKLKKIGAVNLKQSLWILPHNQENNNLLKNISNDIEEQMGEALLAECTFVEGSHERRIIEIFNRIRDEEYGEFIRECEKYLLELDKEIAIQKFTFAELEEEEEELFKLQSWHSKIEKRDCFHSDRAGSAQVMLERIKDAFELYANLVYMNIDKQVEK